MRGRWVGSYGLTGVASPRNAIARSGTISEFDLSPDERQIAVERTGDIWLLDVTRGVLSRFTSDPGIEGDPIWSPEAVGLFSALIEMASRNCSKRH